MLTQVESDTIKSLRDSIHDLSVESRRLGDEKMKQISEFNMARDASDVSVDPRYIDRSLATLNNVAQSYFAESHAYANCEKALTEFIDRYVLPF
jgi:hypothetical protein